MHRGSSRTRARDGPGAGDRPDGRQGAMQVHAHRFPCTLVRAGEKGRVGRVSLGWSACGRGNESRRG